MKLMMGFACIFRTASILRKSSPIYRRGGTRYVFQSKLVSCNFSCLPCTTESKIHPHLSHSLFLLSGRSHPRAAPKLWL